MANYLKTEVLCEAYTHLESDIFDDKAALAALKNQLLPFFTDRAKFLMGEDIEIRIEFESGSLKTKLTVLGSAGALLLSTINGIAAYSDFRQGIEQLANDATTLAQSANLEVLFRTKTAYCDRVRIEKRKGVFGRVNDLLAQLDNIKADLSIDKLPSTAKALGQVDKNLTRLIDWNTTTDHLFEKLDSDTTKGCIAAGLLEELEKLPDEPEWAPQLETRGFRQDVIAADPEHAANLAGTAARFKTTVALLRKQMLQRVKTYEPKNA